MEGISYKKLLLRENGMAQYALAEKIIGLGEADSWDKAKLEWSLVDIFKEDTPDVCLCGHYPIHENCVLENHLNGNRAIVGNVCVKKFLGLPSDKIFDAINRIAKDRTRAINAETIDHRQKKAG